MDDGDILAQAEKYLSGGQALSAIKHWIKLNKEDLEQSTNRMTATIYKQINEDLHAIGDNTITEQQLRKNWRRAISAVKFRGV